MRKIFAALFCIAGCGVVAQGQYLQWAYAMGLSNQASKGRAVTTDATGNVIVAGYFKGTFDFDPGSDSDKVSSTGYGNAYLMTLDHNGNYLGKKVFGTSPNSNVTAGVLHFDGAGNLFIAGYYTGGNVDFDPDTSVVKMSAIGNGNNAFLMKLNTAGKLSWVKGWNYNKDAGGANGTLEEGPSMVLDGQGNIYCAGQFLGEVDFDPDTSVYKMRCTQSDGYIMKLDGNGDLLWAKQIAADTTQSKYVNLKSLSVDAAGNVFVCGNFKGTADFNPDTTIVYPLSAVSQQGFLLKLDAAGSFQWARKIGKDNADPILNYNSVNAVVADASGNTFITGSFMEDVNLGSTQLSSQGLSDIFIARLDASGNYVWAQSAGTFYDGEQGYRMTMDASGDLFVTGNFHSTINFSGTQLVTNGGSDIFVLKMSPSGNIHWAAGFGGPDEYERIQDIHVHGNEIYSVGRMVGPVNFDPNGYYYQSSASTNPYYANFFVQKLGQSVTGIKDVDELGARIFPNPATDRVRVDLSKAGTSKVDVCLWDMLGRQVMETELTASSPVLKVENLPRGHYIMKLQSDKRMSSIPLSLQ